ncbi:anti-virulence regulator CigR family protein [Citrobacter sedlakii]|uniref:anti-virulence regulator CigR family protein n=1 Tax=Citrobacter sedlakii TaxID=67826 RepID=UPI00333B15BE
MGKRRGLTAVLATLVSLSLFAAPVMANPGNGNGNGGGHGNSSGNHGNKGNQGNQGNKDHKGNSGDKKNISSDKRKNYGKPDHVDSDISFATARHLAVNYGLTGYDALPPGIAKNLARGKPLPPGIAKKAVPASMLGELPYYPGYEWRIVGDDLVLIALSTAVVTAIINGVFD